MRNLRHVVVTAVILSLLLLGSAIAPAGAAGPYDAFNQPRVIPGGSNGGSFTGNNSAATKQPPCEPQHANDSGGHSVWLKLGARASRSLVRMNLAGSSFDTLLAVYRGASLCSLTRVAQNDDCRGIGSSCVAFVAQANTSYRIAIDGWDGDSGNYKVNFTRQNV